MPLGRCMRSLWCIERGESAAQVGGGLALRAESRGPPEPATRSCLIPRFDGAILSKEWKEILWTSSSRKRHDRARRQSDDLRRQRDRAPADQAQPPMEPRGFPERPAGRADEPHDQGCHGQGVPLRQPRPTSRAPCGLPRSLQPPDAGTEHPTTVRRARPPTPSPATSRSASRPALSAPRPATARSARSGRWQARHPLR